MDPITTSIVSAITAGVVAGAGDAGKKLIVDSYTALKNAIQAKLGADSKLSKAIVAVEDDPDSKGQQMVLQEQVTKANADKDPDLLALAQTLAEALKSAGGDTFNATAGKKSTIVQGNDNVVATGGSFAVGGNVEGGIHTGGKKED